MGHLLAFRNVFKTNGMKQEMYEKAKLETKARHEENVNYLHNQVNAIGIENDFRPQFSRLVPYPYQFNLGVEKAVNNEKLALKLHFEHDETRYDFTAYKATLLHPIPIEQRTINGINTKELESKMAGTDWHYGIAETTEEVVKGYRNVETIETDLKQLCGEDAGKHIAVHLWNNLVPVNTVPKPDFIREVEAAYDPYTSCVFSADTHLEQACNRLKELHVEETKLEEPFLPKAVELAFYESSPGEILQHLQNMEADGNFLVAYLDDPTIPIGKDELPCFHDHFDAQQHCYENSTDIDRYTYTSIENMKGAVSNWNQLTEFEKAHSSIEQKLATTNWQYDQSPYRHVWEKSVLDIKNVYKELAKLSWFPRGIEMAKRLWDKYVPSSYGKPFFLQNAPKDEYKLDKPAVTQSLKETSQSKTASKETSKEKVGNDTESSSNNKRNKHRRRLE